jgi:phage terminase small subunit
MTTAPGPKTPFKLTPKQEKFAELYVQLSVASDAYRGAYSTARMTDKQIWEESCKLLKHPKVAQRIEELRERVRQIAEERFDINVEKVLRELSLIGFANMLDYVTPQVDGTAFVDLSKLTRNQAAAIQEVTVEGFKEGKGETTRDVKKVRFKLADKRAALVDLGKHLGMFVERREVGGAIKIQMLPGDENL